MIFWGFFNLYGTFNSHPAAPPYVPPHGRYVAGKIGHSQNGSENYPKFSTFVELVCLVGAHTGPRPGG